MPHMTIEYSANLDGKVDMHAFCDAIRCAMLSSGLFEVGAVRVRAVRCEAYSIADALSENSFIDMSLRIGAGRPMEARREAGESVMATATDFLDELLKGSHFALSLEIREIDPGLSWKVNSIHPRLRATQAEP